MQAIACMLGTVVCLSLIPVFIKGGSASAYPFLFTGAWRLIVCVASLSFIGIFYRRLFRSGAARAAVRKNGLNRHFALGIVSILDYALFAAASRFVDTVIVSVIFESWPLFFVLYMSWLYKGTGRYSRNFWSRLGFMLLAFAGIGFAAASSNGPEFSGDLRRVLQGVSLAVLAAMATIITAHVFKWASQTAEDYRELCESPGAGGEEKNIYEHFTTRTLMTPEVLFAIFAYAICCGFGAVLNIAVSAFTGEWRQADELLFGSIAGGVNVLFILAAGAAYTGVTVLWRLSNVITKNLAINTLIYLVPVFTVFLLWFFFDIKIARPDYFLIAATAIITANLLVNFDAAISFSYKGLIVSFWGSGVIVHLCGWFQLDILAYFYVIAISTAMFVMAVSFRLNRVLYAAHEEKFITLDLLRKLFNLSDSARVDIARQTAGGEDGRGALRDFKDACRARLLFLKIDASGDYRQIRGAYVKITRVFSRMAESARRRGDKNALREIYSIASSVDKLILCHGYGKNFGELVAIFILGASPILVMLFAYPAAEYPMSAVVIKLFATAASASIVFMFFNIVTIQQVRSAPVVSSFNSPPEKRRLLGVKFGKKLGYGFERELSIVVCAVIFAVFSYVFWSSG